MRRGSIHMLMQNAFLEHTKGAVVKPIEFYRLADMPTAPKQRFEKRQASAFGVVDLGSNSNHGKIGIFCQHLNTYWGMKIPPPHGTEG